LDTAQLFAQLKQGQPEPQTEAHLNPAIDTSAEPSQTLTPEGLL
jgi:hypothetical protein